MYRLQTTGDFVFFLVLNVAILALGVALLWSPAPPLPTERAAYERVSGTVAAFEHRRGRRHHRLAFTLQADPRQFESRLVSFDHVAATWQAGVTPVAFHVLRRPPDAGPSALALEVYGLADSTRVHGQLHDDVARANARLAPPWVGWLPVGLGVLGLAVLRFAWRRRAR